MKDILSITKNYKRYAEFSTVDFSRLTPDGTVNILSGDDAIEYLVRSALTVFRGQFIHVPSLGTDGFAPFVRLSSGISFLQTEIGLYLANCFPDITFYIHVDTENTNAESGKIAFFVDYTTAFSTNRIYIDSLEVS
jgi:hypothetical protein